jgi:DNA-binding MurR/RpiR family transcriptional regulator
MSKTKSAMNMDKIIGEAQLTEIEMTVLNFLIAHIDNALEMGVREIARENYTSTSTVMRLSKKLGYNGFIDMYYKLLAQNNSTEDINNSSNTFVEQFEDPIEIKYDQYSAIKIAAKEIADAKNLVFIYGTGFMGMMAEYLAKKLLVIGVKVIYSNGADSIGIFENNLEDISVLILFSRSGRSNHVINRATTARENGIYTISFLNDKGSPLADESDCLIKIHDDNIFDDRNQKPTLFFSKVIGMIELLIYEYYRLKTVKSDK